MDEQMRDVKLSELEIMECLERLKTDHGGTYFEPECPACTAFKKLTTALSQPAAQGDSSHPAGGGVPHPATAESFIGESEQADFDADTWTFKMQPGYSVGAGFYRISYIGLTAPKATP